MTAEAKQALENMTAVVEAAGSSMSKMVKTTVLLTNMADFAAVNEVYAGFFPENPPARAAYTVAALPAASLVEIDGIALE